MLRVLALSALSVAALYVGVIEPMGDFYDVWISRLVTELRNSLSVS